MLSSSDCQKEDVLRLPIFAVERDHRFWGRMKWFFVGPSPGKPQVESKFMGKPPTGTHRLTQLEHTANCFRRFGIES